MKKIFLIIAAFLFSAAAIAQIPQLFKYQGLARGSDGNPVSNTTISLRISIHQGTPAGTVVYKETHHPTTNEFGSFSINIGAGTVVTGNFSTIPWSRYNYFQEVEMDVTGGSSFVSMGTSRYLSVPYTLTADSARNGIAPFWVQNTSNGNDTSSVAIIAIANGHTSAIFCKNNGPGGALYAESANGAYILADSNGFETNGYSNFQGKVRMNDSLRVMGPTELNSLTVGGNLTTPILNAGQGNFNVGLTSTGITVNGSANVNGGLNVTGLMGPVTGSLFTGTQGHFSTSVTTNDATILGNANVNGKLYVGDSILGQVNTTLVNGTQANFSVSVITNSLSINGNGNVNGNFHVAGTLTKGAGSFKIDHPLDPMNKYLYHSFVESPDMKNIYDGTITTDADGNAVVELPAYFEALNRDFRYQLTAIGQFAQALVSEEISNNKFSIKTDKPNVKISWQVTGIRKDAYAEKNRIIPEVEKTKEEKGKYLYPDAYK
jgi:hypothetical protein